MPLEDPPRAAAWLRLLRTPGLGPRRIARLLERHGHPAAVLEAVAAGAAEGAGPPPAEDDPGVAADLRWLEAPRRRLLSLDDPDYPPLLAAIEAPPAALFLEGEDALLWHPQIAVVGSRNPTAGGRDNAAAFAAGLGRAGLVVTSGLASGIDTAAHAAALDAGGTTIAVMGTGPDRIYPARNRALAERIAAEGLLVTEYPCGTGPRREHFPQRNRIVAGLSLGTLVVEAALQSGALISARLAAEAGREVFALPGSIHNPLARGCHRLIREGATLVETVDDIVQALAGPARELGRQLRQRLDAPEPCASALPSAGRAGGGADDPAYARLLAALGHDPVPLDLLARRTGLTVDALSSMLLVLELEGRVTATHGRYARVGR
ncbi:MAG: DNA processing protein DprA [Lysobacteraceae bacterium]|nr:MAG: DNA processing protein DprA [Xanthomonadaceae bacterium]